MDVTPPGDSPTPSNPQVPEIPPVQGSAPDGGRASAQPQPSSPAPNSPSGIQSPPPLESRSPEPYRAEPYRPVRAFVDGPTAGAPGHSSRRSGRGWLWALLIVGAIGLLGVVGLVWVAGNFDGAGAGNFAASGNGGRHDNLREIVIDPSPSRDKIAIIDLQGVISGEPIEYEGSTLVDFIEAQLSRAGKDSHVKAVILKIDSPGGEVLASDEIYKLIADFQESHDKPVIASMGAVAASGGYYVAAPCRWIVANELTITGSIGVIMHSYNWRGLMDKVGIRPQVFKSGQLKDMLSPDKRDDEITTEERRIVQDLVNETFERFKSVVEEGRALAQSRNEDNAGEDTDHGRPLAKNWQDYADGRLVSGKDAWKLGFVDELGDFDDAVERAEKIAGIEQAKLVQYQRPASFGSLFHLLGKSEETKVKIDLGLPTLKLRSGLYFLAPHLAR